MATYSVTPGSGVILLSTHWSQRGQIRLADGSYSDLTYNAYCPLDSNTGERSVTGCTNTAASQILYYWIERGMLKLNLSLCADDSYVSSYKGSTVKIDETEETADKNGYLAFSKVNSHLSQFTVNDAEDIAALNFACGVVQQAHYSSSVTGTAWNTDLFLRAGMAGCTDLCTYGKNSNANPYFFDYSSGSCLVTDAGFEILANELLAGRLVGTSSSGLSHALVFDGYNAENDTFHINYGWGGLDDGWYTKEEINENKYYQFLIDLMPSYDGSPILVTSSASYGVGTFLRGLEQLYGITAADTLTVQNGVAGSHIELQKFFRFDKAITINNLNSELVFSETSYIIDSSADITINGLSGTLSNEFDNYSVYAVKTSQNLTVNDLSGVVSVSGDYSTAFSAGNLNVNGMKGAINVYSKGSSASVLEATQTLNAVNLAGTVIAANSSSYSQYTFSGNSVNLQNFCGISISAAASSLYSSYAVNVSGGTLDMSLNNGRIHAGKYTSQSAIAALQEDLSLIGAAGTAAAIKYNGNVFSNFCAAGGSTQDDIVRLKNYSILQGSIFLGGGSDTLSVLGGSYVYAPAVSNVEYITVDSTSTICGLFYGNNESLTLDMIITAETPSEEMIFVLSNAYNFTSCLKDQTLYIDLRGAKDGEYVLVNAAGTSYADSLSDLSAEISMGSSTFTLQCGESANHVSLKYEEEKLILVLDDYAAQATGALLFDGDTLKSVSDSVSSLTLSGDDTDSLRLTDGGAAENITVNEGGDLSVSGGGTATGTTVNAYGILAVNAGGKAVNTTVNADGILNLASSGTLAGSLTLEDEAEVKAAADSTIDFTLNGFTASTYSGINDISRITGTPAYTLTVSQTQSAGKYILAGNAADFTSTITVCGLAEEYSLNLSDSQSFQDAGKKYSLVCENSCLALEITVSSKPEVDIEWFWYIDGGRLNVSAETGYTVSYALTENPENWINYTEPLELIQGTYYFKAENSSGIARTQIKGYLHQSNTSGGAIANSGTQTLNNTYFAGNTANDGGAIYNSSGSMTLSSAVFSGNSAICGAAVYNASGEMNIRSAKFISNTADSNVFGMGNSGSGGAVYNAGTMTLSSAEFSGNYAGGSGGAIYNAGTMYLNDASFVQNAVNSFHYQAGADIFNTGTMFLSNVHFSGEYGNGGTVCNYYEGNMTLKDVQFESVADTIFNNGSMTLAGNILLAGYLYSPNVINAADADITLDVSRHLPVDSYIISDYSKIANARSWSVLTGAEAVYGQYALIVETKDFNYTLDLKNTDGVTIAESLAVNSAPVSYGEAEYSLRLDTTPDHSYLYLDVSPTAGAEIEWKWNINQEGKLEISTEDGYEISYYTTSIYSPYSPGYPDYHPTYQYSEEDGYPSMIWSEYTEPLALCCGIFYLRAVKGESIARTKIAEYGPDQAKLRNAGILTLQNGYFHSMNTLYTDTSGAAVFNTGEMLLNSALFKHNSALFGGAIFNSGTLELGSVSFEGNYAGYSGYSDNNGGAVYNGSRLIFSYGSFCGNSATGNGGAVYNSATGGMESYNCSVSGVSAVFSSNSASSGGAAANYAEMTLDSASFSGNSAAAYGGAVYNEGSMTLRLASFSGNSAATYGGAIQNYKSMEIGNAVFSGNSSYLRGGAIQNQGSMTLSSATFSGNSALSGGAIDNAGGSMIISSAAFTGNSANMGGAIQKDYGSMTLEQASFSGNSATGSGGAVYNFGGSMTLSLAEFCGNQAEYCGGALLNYGSLTIFSATFSGNSANNAGGAIFDWTGMQLSSAAFYSNYAAHLGGAICNSGCTELSSASFKQNSANSGGAVFNERNLSFLSSAVFSGNSANSGGAVFNSSSSVITFGGKAVFSGNKADCGGAIYNSGTIVLTDARFETDSDTIYNAGNMTFYGTISLAANLYTTTTIQASEAEIVYDLTSLAAGSTTAIISDLSRISSGTSYTVAVQEEQAFGSYLLAGNAASFHSAVSLTVGGSTYTNVLNVGESYSFNQTRYTLTLQENALNLVISADSKVPSNLQGDKNGVSWDGVPETSIYQLEYTKDGFEHSILIQTEKTGLDTFALSHESFAWRVKADNGAWVAGENIMGETAAAQRLVSTANGLGDLFFANASGVWESSYLAQHLGFGTWEGTGEYAAIAGKNILADFFVGSEDANLLLLTDSENGDALFMDDIYTALPANVQNQSRIQDIREIRAGAGADVIDLTSQQFSYTGGGMTIRGGDGDDTVWTNKGENKLFGDAGNDRLAGGTENDVIAGGAGNDSMHGGGGNDIFVFCTNWGKDTIEQLAGGSVTLWFVSDSGTWDKSTLTYTDGENSVSVTGILDITLKFGDDGSEEYDTLVSCGAFMASSTEKIFEEEGKGTVAVL